MKDEIASALDEIRPYLQRDGGDVEFVDYDAESGVLKVKLVGSCRGCPYSQMTLANGIKQTLQRNFPQLNDVVGV
ncbi:MAG: NifU family protein [Candidatus Heimdallarchaeota archaeon]|nr:NifU family protein [Candidatus Heimdallarchaeota archaeon]